jgi:hypothetical protein
VWFALLFAASAAQGQAPREFDFYLTMSKCSSTVAYLVQSDQSLKILDGETSSLGCVRTGRAIECAMIFERGQKGVRGNTASYAVFKDSPPMLGFSDAGAGDWFLIDTAAHSVALVTRIATDKFAGSKVCQGFFATAHEIDTFEPSKPTKK